jgi:hypothetical protein
MDSSALAAWALIALLAQGASAPTPATPSAERRIVLTLPRTPAAQEAAWLSVRVGVLPRGLRILVLSDDGKLLGSISPFAIAPGKEAGTYTIPLPDDAVKEGQVAVRLVVEERGVTRSPTGSEVEDVGLVYAPVSR